MQSVEFYLPAKMHGDPPFRIKPPCGVSEAGFTFSSSDARVARADGDIITLVGPGIATITARAMGPRGGSTLSYTTQLMVGPHPCLLLQNGLMWLAPHAETRTWRDAKVECDCLFAGESGWRLPTTRELQELFGSRAFSQSYWPTGRYWSTADDAFDQPGTVGTVARDGRALENPTAKHHVAYVRRSPSCPPRSSGTSAASSPIWELVSD